MANDLNSLPAPPGSSGSVDLNSLPPPPGNAMQVSIKQDQATGGRDNNLGDYLKQGLGMATAHMLGVAKAATLGNFDPAAQVKGWKEASDQHPYAERSGELQGAIAAGAASPSLPEIGGGAAGRLVTGAATGGIMGAAAKPAGQDTLENRLEGAKEGAMLGGAGQGALEAARAIPSAIGAAAKNVVKGDPTGYYDRLTELLKGKELPYINPDTGEKTMVNGENLANRYRVTTGDTHEGLSKQIKTASPEARNLIQETGDEFKGIVKGGASRLMRRLSGPTGSVNSPTTLKSLLGLTETVKNSE